MTRTIPILDANENPGVCGRCGGQCCQSAPGEFVPEDLSPSLDRNEIYLKMRDMVVSGSYSVDWWEGIPPGAQPAENESLLDKNGYFLRVATRRGRGLAFDASWGGVCSLLSESGCQLSADQRPHGCRALVPSEDRNCRPVEGWNGKQSAALAWWPYRALFRRLRLELQGF